MKPTIRTGPGLPKVQVRTCDALEPNAPGFCQLIHGHTGPHRNGNHGWADPCGVRHPNHWGIACDKTSGHVGAHMADALGSKGDKETWVWDGTTECGAVKIAMGGVQLFCQRPAGHEGDHRRSDVSWPRTVLVSRKKTRSG